LLLLHPESHRWLACDLAGPIAARFRLADLDQFVQSFPIRFGQSAILPDALNCDLISRPWSHGTTKNHHATGLQAS